MANTKLLKGSSCGRDSIGFRACHTGMLETEYHVSSNTIISHASDRDNTNLKRSVLSASLRTLTISDKWLPDNQLENSILKQQLKWNFILK